MVKMNRYVKKKERISDSRGKKSILYNASVTDNGIPAREILESVREVLKNSCVNLEI